MQVKGSKGSAKERWEKAKRQEKGRRQVWQAQEEAVQAQAGRVCKEGVQAGEAGAGTGRQRQEGRRKGTGRQACAGRWKAGR